MAKDKIKPLLSALEALVNFLSGFKIKNVIIGGIAASLLGKPRFTADRVVLLKHRASGINIDLALGLLPFEIGAIKRAKIYKTFSTSPAVSKNFPKYWRCLNYSLT